MTLQSNLGDVFATLFFDPLSYGNTSRDKDSFLKALREVAPDMELFLENLGQYIKNCDKIYLVHTKLYISPFYKKNCILKSGRGIKMSKNWFMECALWWH